MTDAATPSARVAVVTGAAGGIGAAIARRLLRAGHSVVAVDRERAALETMIAQVSTSDETGGGIPGSRDETPIIAITADLARPDERDAIVPAALNRFGRIDVLVNNAADDGSRVGFLDLELDEWDRVLATNLTAPAVLAQQAARDMIIRGAGVIVNITAIQERLPMPTYAAYGATKGGISALTRTLAAELSPQGIRVNAIAPGMIATPSLDTVRDPVADSPTLLRRDGAPDDTAHAVAFLTSPDAAFITGTVLTVDGGRVISRRNDPLLSQLDPHTGGSNEFEGSGR